MISIKADDEQTPDNDAFPLRIDSSDCVRHFNVADIVADMTDIKGRIKVQMYVALHITEKMGEVDVFGRFGEPAGRPSMQIGVP